MRFFQVSPLVFNQVHPHSPPNPLHTPHNTTSPPPSTHSSPPRPPTNTDTSSFRLFSPVGQILNPLECCLAPLILIFSGGFAFGRNFLEALEFFFFGGKKIFLPDSMPRLYFFFDFFYISPCFFSGTCGPPKIEPGDSLLYPITIPHIGLPPT